MFEGMREELQEPSWEERKKKLSADFHLDPSKEIDPVESLIEKYGPEGAYDHLMDHLEQSPNDEEVRRRANLLVNRLEDLTAKLRGKIGH